jgi:repressor LexA
LFDILLEAGRDPNARAWSGGSGGMTTGRRPPGDDHGHQLTPRRQQIFDYIHSSMERRGHSPSMREIADAVGLKSVSTVRYQLEILKDMGYLDRYARLPRTVVARPSRLRVLELTSDEAGEALVSSGSQNAVSVPVFDRIAAGTGVIANSGSHLRQGFQYSEDTMQLPRNMVGFGTLFAVRVVGDSMVNASIFDGDLVVVRQQDSADEGDIVAALIEEEATVKTLQYTNDHVWLMPQNPAHKPILGDDCRIMGKVVATVHQV